MALADTIEKIRSGLFQIIFINALGREFAFGSAFLSCGLLFTNNHVFQAVRDAQRVAVRRHDSPTSHSWNTSSGEFASRLVTGSDKSSYDYAVLRVPEVINDADHQFAMELPTERRIGDEIILLGFPLEHNNLTCHRGIISSFFQSRLADVIQIDASVNAGNSGGPLIDPRTEAVIGMVTRKATGLTRSFESLRTIVSENIADAKARWIVKTFGTLDPTAAFIASQEQMLRTFAEIERQANVGIGYAFSTKHLFEDHVWQDEA